MQGEGNSCCQGCIQCGGRERFCWTPREHIWILFCLACDVIRPGKEVVWSLTLWSVLLHFQWLTKQKRSQLQLTVCEYNQRITSQQVRKAIILGNVDDVISCGYCFKFWWAYALLGEKGSEEKIEANISRVSNRFYEDFIFMLAMQLCPCMSGYHL